MQKFEGIGNLTRDLELKTVKVKKENKEIDTYVTIMSLAINNKNDDVLFVDIYVWGRDAENACKYLIKGSKIYVEAFIENRNYTDKDGIKHYTYKFTATNIEYLSSPKSEK